MAETLADTIADRTEFYVQALNTSSSERYNFIVTRGRKYNKVVNTNGGVHAFIEVATGDVYKPAGWAKPADHVRFRLMDDVSYAALMSAASKPEAAFGGYLYIR